MTVPVAFIVGMLVMYIAMSFHVTHLAKRLAKMDGIVSEQAYSISRSDFLMRELIGDSSGGVKTVGPPEEFTITDEWIAAHATHSTGGWTYAQFQALGLPTPPERGWRQLMVGKVITKKQKQAFEAAKHIRRAK